MNWTNTGTDFESTLKRAELLCLSSSVSSVVQLMLTKTQPDEIQDFLSDASYLRGGNAERVVFPETAEEVAEILAEATRERTPVTISGAGTGTVAGRVPFGGIVIATDKLNHIKQIVHDEQGGGRAIAEAGVILRDFQRAVEV